MFIGKVNMSLSPITTEDKILEELESQTFILEKILDTLADIDERLARKV